MKNDYTWNIRCPEWWYRKLESDKKIARLVDKTTRQVASDVRGIIAEQYVTLPARYDTSVSLEIY